MAFPAQTDPQSFAAFCDGVDTTLPNQPIRPSHSVLRARRRILFGVPLPLSSAGNEFTDLYNADGTKMTFRSRDDVSEPLLIPLAFSLRSANLAIATTYHRYPRENHARSRGGYRVPADG